MSRILYLDNIFRCHSTNYGNEDWIAWEDASSFFDGKSRAFIEGYRVIPEGMRWTDPDTGVTLEGLTIAPAIQLDIINVAQVAYEEAVPLASLMFVAMAQSEQIDDVTITEHADVFVAWDEHGNYAVRDIRRYSGRLYRCVQAHTAQTDWTPDKTPALWTPIGDPAEEWPQWSQPIGAHDAYELGAKVSHSGKRWQSTAGGNVWEPGVYGWEAVGESDQTAAPETKPTETVPEWVQPTGAQDAYGLGAKVSYKNKVWSCVEVVGGANPYAPDVWGWREEGKA